MLIDLAAIGGCVSEDPVVGPIESPRIVIGGGIVHRSGAPQIGRCGNRPGCRLCCSHPYLADLISVVQQIYPPLVQFPPSSISYFTSSASSSAAVAGKTEKC